MLSSETCVPSTEPIIELARLPSRLVVEDEVVVAVEVVVVVVSVALLSVEVVVEVA